MNSFLKMLVYRIPRLRELREEVEFLKEENSRLIKGIDAERGSNNFLNFRKEELDRLHEEVVERNWGILPSRKHLFCFSPFKRIEILTNGDVYTCCSAHLKHGYFIGNLFEEEVEEIWNSEKAKKLRYSVSEGDFEYCNHMCRWLHQDKEDRNDSISPVREREEVAVHYKNYQECSLQEGPVEISLSCDDTCNLYCQSCRAKRKVLDKEGSEKLYQILMTKVRPMLVTCKNLSALGSGDIFSSQALSRFYQTLSKEEFPDLELLIIINIIAAICLILFAILFWYNKRKAILLVSLCLAGIFLYRGIQIYRENKLWYHQNIYIAHAMGGIDGIGYTNSLEAFETAYQNGLRVFEVDFSMTSDNKIVLKHDWENLSGMIGYESGYIPTLEEYKSIKLYEKYTTLDIYDLFELMLKYRDIYIVTDSKLAAYEEVVEQFNLLSSILKNYNLSDQKHILEHSIIQLYNDNMLNAVESVIHFDNYIYTLYQRGLDDIEILADFCVKNKIPVITMPYSWWTEEVNNLLHKKGLKVFLHTLNDSKEVQDYLNSGVDGIYTDFITVSD